MGRAIRENLIGKLSACLVAALFLFPNLSFAAIDAAAPLTSVYWYATGSYTYTPPANFSFADVEMLGAGGASGSLPATTHLTNSAYAQGGGAGGFAQFRYTSTSPVSLVVGSGGVAAIGSTGTSGGSTTFGSIATCTGGNGGGSTVTTGSQIAAGAGSGSCSGSAVSPNFGVGEVGGMSIIPAPSAAGNGSPVAWSGGGGSTKYGQGGIGRMCGNGGVTRTHQAAQGFGSGGGGNCSTGTFAAAVGTSGASGLIRIEEHTFVTAATDDPIDYDLLGRFWGWAFTAVLALWLVAFVAGVIIRAIQGK